MILIWFSVKKVLPTQPHFLTGNLLISTREFTALVIKRTKRFPDGNRKEKKPERHLLSCPEWQKKTRKSSE